MIFVALAMVMLLGFLGLGIDMGYLRYMKRQVQTAADAAAIAGAVEVHDGSAAVATGAETAVSTDNSFPNVTQSTGCTPAPAVGHTAVLVNNPPTCVSTDPHKGDSGYVEVYVAENVPTFFSKIFGANSVTVSARAEALATGNCMYALDPSGPGALTAAIGLTALNCGVVDESNSGNAFTCFIAAFDAPYIGVVGKDGFPLCLFSTQPTLLIPVPQPADPLAYRQASMIAAAPSHTTCGSGSGKSYAGSASQLTINAANSPMTLSSGTYCGGITLNPGAVVTFNPGIYTLTSTSTSNGGLTVDPATTVSGGGGVAFYNYGPYGPIKFNCSSCTPGSVTLTAPTSGAFEGILFFQDPGNLTQSQVFGSITYNTKLTGTSYFPSAKVIFAFDILVDYNDLVAKDITYGVAGIVTTTNGYNNCSTLAHGCPIKGAGQLVE